MKDKRSLTMQFAPCAFRRCNIAVICSVVVLCVVLVGCSSDDGKSADLQRQLDMRADISPEDLAALRAQIEELMGRADVSPDDLAALRAQVETLMGRADISPEDLAAIQGNLEAFKMARMMRQQEEQARLDAQTMAGLAGGLARSPGAAVYATSEADTVASLLPGRPDGLFPRCHQPFAGITSARIKA